MTTVSAEDVNTWMRAQGDDAAWKPGTQVLDQVAPRGKQYQMVVTQKQAQAILEGENLLGDWATPNAVPSQDYARKELQILLKFKADVKFVVTVETTQPTAIMAGETTRGAPQVKFIAGHDNLRVIGAPRPLPEH